MTISEDPEKENISNKQVKIVKVVRALENNSVCDLQRYAKGEYGLVSDDVRRKVWPKLIGVDIFSTSPKPSQTEIENHPYYTQVVLDVNRSLKRFPPSIKEQQRLAMQDQLVALIMRILIKHPKLHYYQGYHDICVTFLLVLGEEIGFNVIEKLSTQNLSVFMEETMLNTSEMLEHIFILIGRESPALKDFLLKSEVGVMFCLSWIITWFGHVLVNYNDVVRLFDLFMATHSWMPLYVSAAIVLQHEEEILLLDCDMPAVHSFLSNLPDRELSFEVLITRGLELIELHPPLELQNEQLLELKNNPKANKLRKSIVKKIPSWTIRFTLAALVIAAAIIIQVYRR